MAEDNVIEADFNSAGEAIERAAEARVTADQAYMEAFDEFAEIEHEYEKLTGTEASEGGLDKIKGLISRFGPTAFKFFGAGGAGAGLMLALSKDGTGAGILSKISGMFGFGGAG